jgi:hypothetical protein
VSYRDGKRSGSGGFAKGENFQESVENAEGGGSVNLSIPLDFP